MADLARQAADTPLCELSASAPLGSCKDESVDRLRIVVSSETPSPKEDHALEGARVPSDAKLEHNPNHIQDEVQVNRTMGGPASPRRRRVDERIYGSPLGRTEIARGPLPGASGPPLALQPLIRSLLSKHYFFASLTPRERRVVSAALKHVQQHSTGGSCLLLPERVCDSAYLVASGVVVQVVDAHNDPRLDDPEAYQLPNDALEASRHGGTAAAQGSEAPPLTVPHGVPLPLSMANTLTQLIVDATSSVALLGSLAAGPEKSLQQRVWAVFRAGSVLNELALVAPAVPSTAAWVLDEAAAGAVQAHLSTVEGGGGQSRAASSPCLSPGDASPGAAFGPAAAFAATPAAGRTSWLQRCRLPAPELYSLSSDRFRAQVACQSVADHESAISALAASPLLQQLDGEQLSRLALAVEEMSVPRGTVIITKGSVGEDMFFIAEGRVQCSDIGSGVSLVESIELCSGDCFGERALLLDEPRAATVTALSDCLLLQLNRRSVKALIGSLRVILDESIGVQTLRSIPLFKRLRTAELQQLAHSLVPVTFPPGAPLARAGDELPLPRTTSRHASNQLRRGSTGLRSQPAWAASAGETSDGNDFDSVGADTPNSEACTNFASSRVLSGMSAVSQDSASGAKPPLTPLAPAERIRPGAKMDLEEGVTFTMSAPVSGDEGGETDEEDVRRHSVASAARRRRRSSATPMSRSRRRSSASSMFGASAAIGSVQAHTFMIVREGQVRVVEQGDEGSAAAASAAASPGSTSSGRSLSFTGEQPSDTGTAGSSVRLLHSGDYIGEKQLLTSTPRDFTLIAHGGPTTVLALSRDDFQRVVGPLNAYLRRLTPQDFKAAGLALQDTLPGLSVPGHSAHLGTPREQLPPVASSGASTPVSVPPSPNVVPPGGFVVAAPPSKLAPPSAPVHPAAPDGLRGDMVMPAGGRRGDMVMPGRASLHSSASSSANAASDDVFRARRSKTQSSKRGDTFAMGRRAEMATSAADMKAALAAWKSGTTSDGNVSAHSAVAYVPSASSSVGHSKPGSPRHMPRQRSTSSIPQLDAEEDDPMVVGTLAWLQERARTTPVALHDKDKLLHLAPLGVGTFGRVSLVKHAESGKMYALKAMAKSKIVALKQQRNIMYERALLGATSHPFLLSLSATFKDADTLYSLFEWIQGGELFGRIESDGKLPPAAAKFYAASVVHGLAYLHAMHVVYRDLKPENLLIDKTGYIRVVDFGFAKHVPERTYTLCGTPSYLSPECLTGAGYGKSCDWWAVGVLGYEMLTGKNPFDDECGDAQKTVRNVLRMRIEYPEELLDADPKAVGFIRNLLQRRVVDRLGCRMDGAQEVIRHRWFTDVDWKALLRKELPAPWVPHLKSADDVSHFEGALQAETSALAQAAEGGAAGDGVTHSIDDEWCESF